MKISKKRLKRIIQEELQIALDEADFVSQAAGSAIANVVKHTKKSFGSRSGTMSSNVKGLGPDCGPYIKSVVADSDPEQSVEFVMAYQNPDQDLEYECWLGLEDSLKDYYKVKKSSDRRKIRKALKKAKFDKTYQKARENEKAGKKGRPTQIFVKDSTGREITDFKTWIAKIIA